MISKVFSGHSFYHACRYVVNKEGAVVLEQEGVRSHDHKVMSDDFILQQQLRPAKEKACFHCCLSFYPGEKLSDERMAMIAKEYLEKMKITDTQFAITKHTDRKHIHLHIVANLVDNKGKAISDSFLGLRGKKVAQQLTKQYQLVPAEKKNLELTNYEALSNSEVNKYKVYQAIAEALPYCKTMQDLEKRLLLKGIETQYKYKGQTNEKQGVSFKIGEDCFKGSKVDRQFSLGNLEKTLALNQKQLPDTHEASRNITPYQPIQVKENHQPAGNTGENYQGNELVKGIEKTIDILLKPEKDFGQAPPQLQNANKQKKKKQSRGQHL